MNWDIKEICKRTDNSSCLFYLSTDNVGYKQYECSHPGNSKVPNGGRGPCSENLCPIRVDCDSLNDF